MIQKERGLNEKIVGRYFSSLFYGLQFEYPEDSLWADGGGELN